MPIASPAPELSAAERMLVVMAHPDDVDFSAAGTVAAATAAGVAVSYCLITDGDAGGFDDTPREQMRRLRQREQTAAASAVGVHDLTFLGYPDGALYVTHELRRDISRQLRRVRPQRVICSSPERDLTAVARSHPDHRAAGAATLDAVYPDARNPFAHPTLLDEGFEPWTVPEVWITGGDHWVDITDTFDRKLAALRSHASQVGHLDGLADMLRRRGEQAAQDCGLPAGRVVERFQVVSTA